MVNFGRREGDGTEQALEKRGAIDGDVKFLGVVDLSRDKSLPCFHCWSGSGEAHDTGCREGEVAH